MFPKRNRKHDLRVSIELYKHESGKSCGNTRLRLVFPQHFTFSQTSTRVCILDRNTVHVFYFLNIAFSLLHKNSGNHRFRVIKSTVNDPRSKITSLLPPSVSISHELRRQRRFATPLVKTNRFANSFIVKSAREAFK